MDKKAEHERQKIIIDRLSKVVKDKNQTYFITTFGCQMNAHDSEKIKGIVEEIGYSEAKDELSADLVVFNTCAIRENAENKVYGRIGRLKKIKQKRKNMKIALCGCMMQQDIVLDKLKKSYPYVDIVFGTHNLYKVAELIETNIETGEPVYDIWKTHKEIVEDLPAIRKYQFKATVNIMFGCNNYCTYCIVPYVRGRERSRPVEDIIKEIKALADDGVVEVTLLGQNVNSYGKGLDSKVNFSDLLKEVVKIRGIKRVRFMTSHPKDLSDELIDTIAEHKKICNHIHLPVQSGSTKVLKAMNRGYTKADYERLLDKINSKLPNASLTSDIIVGFPNEEDKDVDDTIAIIKKARYSSCFTFIYSRRTGTPAAVMETKADDALIKKRFNRVLEAANQVALEESKKHLGSVVEVLAEEVNDKKGDMLTGRMDDFSLVHFNGGAELIGKLVEVEIVESKGFYLIGKRVNLE